MKSRHLTWAALLTATVFTAPVEAADDTATGAQSGVYGHVYGRDPQTKRLSPLTGAKVELVAGRRTVGQATSDQRGFYSISPVGAGDFYYKVSAAGYRPEKGKRGFSLGLTEGDAVVDFTLEPGPTDPTDPDDKSSELPVTAIGQIIGQVYEKTADGALRGVSGAWITGRKLDSMTLFTVRATAPAEGGKSPSGYLRQVEAGKWRITAGADGFETHVEKAAVEVVDEKQAVRDLILTRPPVPPPKEQGLSGSVVLSDPPAGPAPALRVTALGISTPQTTTPVQPGPQGTFKTETPAGRYVVRAEADGYYRGQSEISEVLPGAYTSVTLKLQRKPADLVVKVFDAETKKPLGPARVRVRRPGQDLDKATNLETDATGQTVFRSLAMGTFQVLAQVPGYVPGGQPIDLTAAGDHVDLYLAPDPKPPTLVLTVLDGNRQPIADAAAKLTVPAAAAVAGNTTTAGTTATMQVPRPGKYPIAVNKPGYGPFQGRLELLAGNNERTVYLRKLDPPPPPPPTPTYTLTLQICSAEQLTPLAGVSVKVTQGTREVASDETKEGGSFVAKLPAPGAYNVNLTRDGYESSQTSIDVKLAEVNKRLFMKPIVTPPPTYTLTLQICSTVKLTPLARVSVKVSQGAREVASDETEEDGSFVAKLPAPGAYTVNLSRPAYEPSQTSIDVNLAEVNKKLFMKPIAVVRKPELWTLNVLVYEGGVTETRPIEGATVKVSNGKMAVVKTGTTDDLGRFPADGLVADLYTAEASKPGYSLREKPRVNISRGDAQVQVSLYHVAKPPPLVTVPDVTGQQSLPAQQAIEYAKLTFRSANDAIQGGTARSQSPAAGSRVSQGTPVVVTFVPDAPPPPTLVTVPELKGSPIGAAWQRLKDIGLVPVYNSDGVDTSYVVAQQRPVAGTQVPLRSGVRLELVARPPPVDTAVTVPDVTGQRSLPAQQAIEYARLTFRAADARIQDGTARSQLPAAGARVSPGTTVVVTFVADQLPPPTLVTVPELKGSPIRAAWQQLNDLGLVPVYNSDGVDTSYVVAQQTPVAGTQVPLRSGVTLELVARPPPVDTAVTVPDVTGQSIQQTKASLESTRLRFGAVNELIPGGTATSQRPAAGTRVNPGTTVVVNFSVPVPDVRGIAYNEAQQRLQDRGLVPQFNPEGVENRSVVAQQDPPAGTQVAPGSGVRLAFASRPTVPVENPNPPTPPGNTNMLVGVWVAQQGSANFDPGSTVEFTADGKYATAEKSSGTYGTYTLYGNKLKLVEMADGRVVQTDDLTITRLTPEGLETMENSTYKKDVFLKR